MRILNETYILANGHKIPKLGLGTWFINNKEVVDVVKEAIGVGYRHFDTAQAYGNEAGVGQAIKESGIARSELFVTSKINPNQRAYEQGDQVIDEILTTLGLDYVDLLLIHAPQPWMKYRGKKSFFEENKQLWKAMEAAYKAGKVKAIGVSNFLQSDLENILENCNIKPMVNQVLAHISHVPQQLVDYCQKNDILVVAHSPIAHGRAIKNKHIKNMAEKYHVSIPQLCIRFLLEQDMLPIPKTSNKAHMVSNADVDFKIKDEDMITLKKIKPLKYGRLKLFPVYGVKDQ